MRINKLRLIRYGHFTDENLEFPNPASGSDFHLIYGPNEAGKSSARLALEDFLFDIPNRSTYGYKHGSSNMQIGAQIQSNGVEFEAVRRKGRANTLRDPETNEALTDGDRELLTLLHHTSRETFNRMFSLDHDRLHKGGQSMLDAEDDVGRALFAATAGLLDLQETLDVWKAEASQLWAPNRSKSRIYYQAKDRFDEASKRVAESSVLARDWENLHRALEDVDRQLSAVREEIDALEPRQRKLSRIRRLKAKVSRYYEVDRQISELGAVMELAQNSMETLNGLVSQSQIHAARINVIEQRIGQLKAERDTLTLDEKTLADKTDIEELNERRPQVEKSKLDLPKHEEDLREELTKFQYLSDRLGWSSLTPSEVAERIPTRESGRLSRKLISQKDTLDEKEKNCRDLLKSATRNREKLEEDLNDIGPVVDADLLNATIETTQREQIALSNLPRLRRQLKNQSHETKRIRETLNPAVSDTTDLESLSVPSREVILNMLDDVRSVEQEQAIQRGRLKDAERQVRAIEEQIDSFLKDEKLVTEEDLQSLRSERDELWKSLKADFLADSSTDRPSSAGLRNPIDRAREYEDKIGESDALADKRFENAKSEARHKEMIRTREQLERGLRDLRERASDIDDDFQRIQSRWKSLWEKVPFEVGDPATMLAWRETRDSLLSSMRTEAELRTEVEQLTELEKQSRQRLCQVLGEFSEETEQLEFDSLAEALAYSRDRAAKIQDTNSARKSITANLKAARNELNHRSEDWETIQQESQEWSSEWFNALSNINLPDSESTRQVAEKLELLDELRDVSARIDDLKKNRISPIQSEIQEFEDRVRSKVQDEYPDLDRGEPIDIIRQLKERLDSSLRTNTRKEELAKQLSDQEDQKEKVIEEQRDTSIKIDQMRALVGARDTEALRSCIRKSDELRSCRDEQSRLQEELRSDGDGLSLSELKTECDSVEDLDAARSEESRLESQLEKWRQAEKELLPRQTEAQMQLNEISGSDEAARAEFEKECALAEMKDAIEKYIPIRASALVLEWAIERFRKERQGPLLKRASEIFNALTLGSFAQIEVQVDGNKPALVAYRNNNDEVRLPGLSEGSLDQLYLAMRVAAIEEHVKGTNASIPFVADDLFTNFDDARATAGLKVLLELSRKCQILFFTHHRHLVDLALEFAPDQVTVTELMSATRAQAVST